MFDYRWAGEKKTVLLAHHLHLWTLRLERADEWLHQREGLSILFVRQGTGRLFLGASAREVGPGDILFFGSSRHGKLRAASATPLGLSGFSLNIEHLFPLLGAAELAQLRSSPGILNATRVYPASSRIAAECRDFLSRVPAENHLRQRGQLLLLAAAILHEEFETTPRKDHPHLPFEDHVLRVLERLSQEQFVNLSVGEIAKLTGCSRWSLNRLLQQTLGVSASGLKMEVRLLKAAFLLKTADVKIINVAEQSGFNHLGLFNAALKKRFGVTPGEFRKCAQNGDGNCSNGSPGENAESGLGLGHHVDGCPMHALGLCSWEHATLPNPSLPRRISQTNPT